MLFKYRVFNIAKSHPPYPSCSIHLIEDLKLLKHNNFELNCINVVSFELVFIVKMSSKDAVNSKVFKLELLCVSPPPQAFV